MRIAFDHTIFSSQVYGGVSRYVYELAKSLANDWSQEVSIVSPLFVNGYLAHHVPDRLTIRGLHVPRIPKTGRLLNAFNSLLAIPFHQSMDADILHLSYYPSRRQPLTQSTVVLTVHDMIHEVFSDDYPESERQAKLQAMRQADHLICISKHTQEDLLRFTDIDPRKTSVIHHGISTQPHSQPHVDVPAKPYLLYVGQRGGYKNFARLLEAISISRLLRGELHLLCFGGGPLSADEIDLAQKFHLPDNFLIHVTGSDALLAGLYAQARAFIYPSLYEGFGFPPLEAMSHHCPVACSNTSSIPEVAGNAAVYFDPTSIEDMRRAIEQVVTDYSLREQLVQIGQARCRQFTWQKCAEQTLQVYQTVCRSR